LTRKKELLLLLLSDFLAINAAWIFFFWVRVQSGWFDVVELNSEIDPSHLLASSILVYVLWVIGFTFFGLYRQWFVRPIFDEIVTILKTLALGTVLFMLFVLWGAFVGSEDKPNVNDPRILGFIYFLLLSFFTISFRLIVRFSQQRLLESGYGRRTSIILGDRMNAESLAAKVSHFPRLGYEVLGYVSLNGEAETSTERKLQRLGELKNLESIIATNRVQEVLITLGSGDHDALLDIMGRTSGSNVGLKIMPDLYDIISGQARTREIYGFPLIDINPELQRPWEETTKRAMDIVTSFIILVAGFPLWLLIGIGVRLTSKGPIIYKQERVGRYGIPFNIYKFRSMRMDAEAGGPKWATKNDPRVTAYGRFLRKSHFDEIPQFFNVLKGDMSLVGPRPERGHFVQLLSKEIPYYPRRLRVRPGVTGLFQAMVYKYDENIDDVRNKLKYDLMYIESMSFRLDIKILFRTVYNVLRAGGHT
jgi:exopolysaccharide biosynthesis polyprenyl glycosylphosphotransferase